MRKIKASLDGICYDVEYSITGFGDDAELDETIVSIDGEELNIDKIPSEILNKIDEACLKDFWESSPDVDDNPAEDK